MHMPHWLSLIAAVLAGAVAAGTAFYIVGRRLISRAATVAATERERLLEEARQRLTLAAKEELIQAREGLEHALSRRRLDLDGREMTLQQHAAAHQERDRELERRDQKLLDRERALAGREQDARTRLEQIAGLSAQEAKEELMRRLEDEARSEAAALLRDIREQARKNSEREGRNIRAFEAATGVDVIIDDTPDTVVISCFDPVRRAVGRMALERLIADGRIHPGRIEENVGKVQEEIEAGIVEAGEAAIYETGIRGMHPELTRLVGRMKYRTSYGQKILDHSKEVAWLAGMMAGELRLDTQLAKRGGLLHDVGKVLTHEHDGTHVQLGIEMATKYGEHPIVINCIAAHHDDVPHETPVSVIVQAADAVSGSRPGARREAFETYMKRMTDLERIAAEFTGVEKVFAIQAGREVRVVVSPTAIDDGGANDLAERIARRIEQDVQYPGQIKVVVVRETRAVN